MHTHMHTECECNAVRECEGKGAVQVGENLRGNSREILSEFSHGRKPNAELYLELGPRLGPHVRQRTFRFSRFVPHCGPSALRVLPARKARSSVLSVPATSGACRRRTPSSRTVPRKPSSRRILLRSHHIPEERCPRSEDTQGNQ